MAERITDLPEIQELFQFPLLEAVFGRRSRRFGLGMEIKEGPNVFKSPHDPVPLSELEEAVLVTVGTGISGMNLSDMPHTPRPEKADDINEWDGMCNTMMEHVGRTWASPCGNHGTELFYTNDEGVYLFKLREKQSSRMREFETVEDREKLLTFFCENRLKLRDGRLDLPRNNAAYMSFNLWDSNMPGTTVFMPVTDITEEYINGIMLIVDMGNCLIDDFHGGRPCGNERWIKEGYISMEKAVPLSWHQNLLTLATCVEVGFIAQNMMLAMQAMGLGGWTYGCATPFVVMGGTPFAEGLGFRFESNAKDPNQIPQPVGLDGLFESFRPPYYKSMREAVDAVVAKKFGPNGTFNPDSDKPAPYLQRADFLRQVPRTPEKTIECTKDICMYIWETFGRFPAYVDPMMMYAWIQAQHIELEFYDKYYRPGAYLATHQTHMQRWHKAAAHKMAKAA
jgi:hypothetical protein